MAKPTLPGQRFWPRVNKTETCWLWTGCVNNRGYGVVTYQQQMWYAHRLAYTLLVGPIPKGMTLDHIKANGCTSTLCVKAIADEHGPTHLEVVTMQENILRGTGPSAIHARKTHCIRGHEFTEANTYRRRNGWRTCRTCVAEKERQRVRRRRR